VTNVRLDRFRAAIFAASVVVPELDGISHHQEGNNIYGAYSWITHVVPKSSIEPFVLWRVAPSVAVEGAGKDETGRLDEKAYGFRIRGTDLANIDYRYEAIAERGSAGTNGIQAWATTAGFGYTMPALKGKPRFFAGYDYASGDKNPSDGKHGTFDTMYPTAHDRFGIARSVRMAEHRGLARGRDHQSPSPLVDDRAISGFVAGQRYRRNLQHFGRPDIARRDGPFRAAHRTRIRFLHLVRNQPPGSYRNRRRSYCSRRLPV